MQRVAVVGAGFFAGFQLEAWARLTDAELVGVCDRDAARAEAAVAKFGGRAFSGLEDMLRAVAPDILDVAVPPAGHAAAVRAGLAAGVRTIICQKPFCTGLDEAEAVVAEAEAAGALLVIHENFRFQPWYRAAARCLAEGRLGTPFGAAFRLRPGDGAGAEAYLARQPYFRTMPRLLVRETGVHFIDVFRFLLGEVEAVFADLRRLNPVISGEDAGMVLLRMQSGARALLDGNRLADHAAEDRRLTMGEMLLEGSAGTLRLDGAGRLWLRAAGAVAEDEVAFGWERRGFGGDCVHALQAHVLRHLAGDGAIENCGRDYLANLRVEAAAYRAAERGSWQSP